MTDADSPPIKIYCNVCGLATVHVQLQVTSCERYEGSGTYMSLYREEWRIFQCGGCHGSQSSHRILGSDSELVSENCHPPHRRLANPEWAQKLPEDFRAIVREVYDAIDVDCLRLAMMGARTLIDLMLTDMLTDDIGGFEQKLSKAVDAGLISASQKGKLAIAIDAGSAASHRGFAPTLSQLEDVLEIVETNLKEQYVVQAASDRLRGTVPQRRKGG